MFVCAEQLLCGIFKILIGHITHTWVSILIFPRFYLYFHHNWRHLKNSTLFREAWNTNWSFSILCSFTKSQSGSKYKEKKNQLVAIYTKNIDWQTIIQLGKIRNLPPTQDLGKFILLILKIVILGEPFKEIFRLQKWISYSNMRVDISINFR